MLKTKKTDPQLTPAQQMEAYARHKEKTGAAHPNAASFATQMQRDHAGLLTVQQATDYKIKHGAPHPSLVNGGRVIDDQTGEVITLRKK
ncbi:MAG: hypothetical protein A3E84_05765 [Gammaproteobacteria bacterium RIFCSPHIGHO2_12_FULL_42_13]|nr:MAG: hypothetical protein A3E84_05765 [Gammaproteobacteria bacterium RIFCSPHIGHO2_12_FULL_42_13]